MFCHIQGKFNCIRFLSLLRILSALFIMHFSAKKVVSQNNNDYTCQIDQQMLLLQNIFEYSVIFVFFF